MERTESGFVMFDVLSKYFASGFEEFRVGQWRKFECDVVFRNRETFESENSCEMACYDRLMWVLDGFVESPEEVEFIVGVGF